MLRYKTRKHQFQAFIRNYKAGKMSLQELVKSVSMCGAEEERYRTLQLVSDVQLRIEICEKSVLEVLGYEN